MPRVTITIPEHTPQPYRFPLDCQSVLLGRGEDNDIVIADGSVSTRHAEMLRVKGGYELRDLGSTNGIKLSELLCPLVPLRDGVSLQLGDVSFDFELTDEEKAELAQEKMTVVSSPVVSLASAAEAPALPAFVEPPPPVIVPPHAPALPPEPEDFESEEPKRGCGVGMLIFTLLLLIMAFFIGMMLRFHHATEGSLPDAIKAKFQGSPTAAPTAK